MIGCGFVGSASVFALMQSGLFTEIVLIDADKDKADGEATKPQPIITAFFELITFLFVIISSP